MSTPFDTSTALVTTSTLALGKPLPADQNPAAVYLARLAPGSRRTMAGALESIAELLCPGVGAMALPWAQLRYSHTGAVRSWLADHYAASTANKMLSALRGVLKEAWRLGQLDAEHYQRAADVAAVAGQRVLSGRALETGELSALMGACDVDTPAGARDAAMVAVLYVGGLRRSELVLLDLADVNRETGELLVRGKGNKQRLVYATGGALSALVNWLSVRGEAPGPLFLPVNKAGRLGARRLTPQAVLFVLGRTAERASVAAFSPHDMRRSCISDLLDAGADISAVQKLAGHASPATTTRYDRRGERAKRRAAGLLHVPWPKRRARRASGQ